MNTNRRPRLITAARPQWVIIGLFESVCDIRVKPDSSEIEPPIRAVSGHAYMMSCLECDLPELLEETRPPDPELVEEAFLDRQIDGQKADLAYLWLQAKGVICTG